MFENACYFPPSLFCHRCATCKLRLENKIGRLITWPTAPWGCTTKYFFSRFMSLQAKMPSTTTATCHMCTKNMHPLDQWPAVPVLGFAFYGHRARKKCGICGPKGIARLQVPYHLDAFPLKYFDCNFRSFPKGLESMKIEKCWWASDSRRYTGRQQWQDLRGFGQHEASLTFFQTASLAEMRLFWLFFWITHTWFRWLFSRL